MPSNYDAIADQNREDYGRRVQEYGKVLLQLLYSDRTHFIFELLQNAEDAGASRVGFHLYHDRLEVHHTGRPFDAKDVRAICGIVAGTKSDDLTTIGRFGIGFKSVYAYTDTPEIHSDDEHFCVRHYVYPEAIPAIPVPPKETRLVFPFNHHEVSAEQAFREIGRRIRSLGARPLLFLRHITEVSWSIEGGASGTYLRDKVSDGPARRITLIGDTAGASESTEEHWLIFSRGVQGHPALKVEAAFRLVEDEKTNTTSIVAEPNTHLVVFFPTEKETHLGFLIQGPYRTTPARDNVPLDDEWNQALVRSTAQLIVETLPHLKTRGLLTVSAIETLPIREQDFPEGSMFEPLFDAVLDTFATERLLPSQGNGFVAADEAILTNSAPIRELLGDDQVRDLFNSDGALTWLSDEITQFRARDLWNYLTQNLSIDDVDGEKIARHITTEFMRNQTDEWVTHFYAFLLDQRALWRPADIRARRGPLGDKPIIRLETDGHIPAYTLAGKPSAFISDDPNDRLPIVRRTISSDPEARDFLEKLGFDEPDPIDELFASILPKYTPGRSTHISDDEHSLDIEKIFRALGTSLRRGAELRQRLRGTAFLFGVNDATRERELCSPEILYVRRSELELYFEGNQDAWFIDDRYSLYGNEVQSLGVADSPRVWRTEPDNHGFVNYHIDTRSYARGLSYFDPEIDIDGLSHALQFPTEERMRFVWNHLLPDYARQIEGEIEQCTRRSFVNATRKQVISRIGRIVRAAEWLPGPDGQLHVPDALTVDDLPADFIRNDQLALALGMRLSTHASHARELGVSIDDINLIKSNWEEFEAWKLAVASGAADASDEDDDEQTDTTVDFAAELGEIFQRTRRPSNTGDEVSFASGTVPNPAIRRERVAAEIASEQQMEPKRSQRFKRVPSVRWAKKNNRARDFLRQEYDGHCQVCDETFPKRDGSSYFEGMYLVSRTNANWLDREGNVLCLCANCCAKLMYGSLEAEDIVDQVVSLTLRHEGGASALVVSMTLCGEPAHIRFTERHLVDLQALIASGEHSE